MESEELDFRGILKHLDREAAHFLIRFEKVPSGRSVTVIEPHELIRNSIDLPTLLHKLKGSLGTGGSVENVRIILHGDHRDRAKSMLVKLGVSTKNVEII